ncbi:MAG: hypothetical protein GY832_15380 [Chloroflexi bacterium]|nr:hypothetical protein [Chloroflexota bacterium]
MLRYYYEIIASDSKGKWQYAIYDRLSGNESIAKTKTATHAELMLAGLNDADCSH